MRIGIVYFAAKGGSSISAVAERMSEGMRSQGHTVELLDGSQTDARRMVTYDYIALGTEATGLFGGKIPAKVAEFLASSSGLGGKKSFAWIKKGGLSPQKTLSNLMRVMEKEGMWVNWSEVVISAEAALAVGKRIGA